MYLLSKDKAKVKDRRKNVPKSQIKIETNENFESKIEIKYENKKQNKAKCESFD
jgi:hypothetical protein